MRLQLLHSPVHAVSQQTPSAQAVLHSELLAHADPSHFGTGHGFGILVILHRSQSALGKQSTHIPDELHAPIGHAAPTAAAPMTINPEESQLNTSQAIGGGGSD